MIRTVEAEAAEAEAAEAEERITTPADQRFRSRSTSSFFNQQFKIDEEDQHDRQ